MPLSSKTALVTAAAGVTQYVQGSFPGSKQQHEGQVRKGRVGKGSTDAAEAPALQKEPLFNPLRRTRKACVGPDPPYTTTVCGVHTISTAGLGLLRKPKIACMYGPRLSHALSPCGLSSIQQQKKVHLQKPSAQQCVHAVSTPVSGSSERVRSLQSTCTHAQTCWHAWWTEEAGKQERSMRLCWDVRRFLCNRCLTVAMCTPLPAIMVASCLSSLAACAAYNHPHHLLLMQSFRNQPRCAQGQK
eukprot:1160804-Pelagomonas_calceolata.AAC.29